MDPRSSSRRPARSGSRFGCRRGRAVSRKHRSLAQPRWSPSRPRWSPSQPRWSPSQPRWCPVRPRWCPGPRPFSVRRWCRSGPFGEGIGLGLRRDVRGPSDFGLRGFGFYIAPLGLRRDGCGAGQQHPFLASHRSRLQVCRARQRGQSGDARARQWIASLEGADHLPEHQRREPGTKNLECHLAAFKHERPPSTDRNPG